MKRTVRIELAAMVAVVLALLGISRVRINSGAPALGVRTEAATGVDDRVGPGEAGPQTAEGNPVTGASPNSRNSTRTEGPSKAGTSPVRGGARSEEENPPAGTSSRYSETAGPPVHYTDQADDAYGQDGGPPNAAVSRREYDILRVDWAPVPYVDEQSPGGYSTSMTIAGSARDDGQYVSEGQFGRDCRVYHFLTPGTTAFANAFCDSSENQWGFVGVVQGGPVASTPTSSGGTRLTATFDPRTIPRELEAAGRYLHNLSAGTCEGTIEQAGLCPGGLDWAWSALSYRV